MTALVTGATGFLGRHLVDRLRGEGLAVRVLARPSARLSFADQSSIEVIPGDMRDPSSLERAVAGVDTVFHLAAATSGDWDEYVETTVLGTRRLLQACVDGGVRRFIYTSSLSIYDLRRRGDTDLVDEFCPLESRPEARANYAATKVMAEHIVLQFQRERQLPICILRPAVVYGPGHTGVSAVALSVRGKLLVVLGDGRAIVPLVHIEDLTDAFWLARGSEGAAGQIYNIVDPQSPTQRQYLSHYRSLAGVTTPVVYVPRPMVHRSAGIAARTIGRVIRRGFANLDYRLDRLTERVRYDSSRAQEQLGWTARTSFADGLARALGDERARTRVTA